jgi:peptidyl-prolyl cis-trans isomerase SurA
MILTCALPARAQTVAATVYGEPITEDDIEQRSKLNFLSTHKQRERQDVINESIDDKKQIREANWYGGGPTSADLDDAVTRMCARMRVTPEQLTKSLEAQGIRLDTLKKRLKADMARATLTHLRRYKF